MAEAKKKSGRAAGSTSRSSSNSSKDSKQKSKKKNSEASDRSVKTHERRKADKRVVDEIWAIISIAVGVFLVIAVVTGGAGQLGGITGDVLKGILGFVAYILPFYIIVYGVLLFARKTIHMSLQSVILILLMLLMLTVMNSVRFIEADSIKLSMDTIGEFYNTGVLLESGGFTGMLLGSLLIRWLGISGCWIVSIVVLIICLLLLINTPVSRFFTKMGERREKKRMAKEGSYLEPDYTVVDDKENPAEDGRVKNRNKNKSSAGSGDDSTSDGSVTGATIVRGSREAAAEEKNDIHSDVTERTERAEESSVPAARKREIKVINSSVLDEDESEQQGESEVKIEDDRITINADKDADKDDDANIFLSQREKNYVPPSRMEEPAERRDSVLQYMNDDSLFDRRPSNSFGLDGKNSDMSGTETGRPSSSREPEENLSDAAAAVDSAASAGTQKKISDKSAGTAAAAAAAGTAGAAGAAAFTAAEFSTGKSTVNKYKKPPLDLLTRSEGGPKTDRKALQAKAEKLEETLRNFRVDAKVVQVTQGPTVTRYEIQPAVGVKVSSIVRLADDIALNLEAKSIRIEAPIPGKAAVGIEVENDAVTVVKLRDVIESRNFKDAKSKITFAVGKDIGGNAIVADLKEMPHLLIAGSTGSGKSVCINSIILSILYKADPDEVKMILIDPKVVELGHYNGIPHLLIPVVTDPSKAAAALNWAVSEMNDRYKKFAEAGVRELASYNEAMRAENEEDKVMPQVVIIIDELADLMMAAPSQIEESICRLAQMARAAGMHLIVATQRPSVDIITGVIKANIPSRIAFAVSSQVDSRTILDMQGAEKLVGKGDMLFNPLGMGKPIRVQGTFVSDKEVNDVITYVKGQVDESSYSEDVINRIEKNESPQQGGETDELLPDAIDLVVKSGQASVSMLQRRFRIGYNRAARIVDMMEERGIIGPADGSRPRQVLLTEAELEEMKKGEGLN